MEVSLGIPKTFLHNSCVSMLSHDLHTALLRGFQNQVQSHLWFPTDIIQHPIMTILSKLKQINSLKAWLGVLICRNFVCFIICKGSQFNLQKHTNIFLQPSCVLLRMIHSFLNHVPPKLAWLSSRSISLEDIAKLLQKCSLSESLMGLIKSCKREFIHIEWTLSGTEPYQESNSGYMGNKGQHQSSSSRNGRCPKIASGELLLFSSPEAEDWSQDGILSLCFEVISSKLLEIIGNIF